MLVGSCGIRICRRYAIAGIRFQENVRPAPTGKDARSDKFINIKLAFSDFILAFS
jgi:hypothetical protein